MVGQTGILDESQLPKPTFAELAAWLEDNPPGESWSDIKDDEDAADYVHRMRRQSAIQLDDPGDDE